MVVAFQCVILLRLYYVVLCRMRFFFLLTVDDVLLRCAFVVYLNFVWELGQWFVAINVYMKRASVLWWKKCFCWRNNSQHLPTNIIDDIHSFLFFVLICLFFHFFIYISVPHFCFDSWVLHNKNDIVNTRRRKKKHLSMCTCKTQNKSESSSKSFWSDEIWPKLPRCRCDKSYDILSLDEKKRDHKMSIVFFFFSWKSDS